MEHITPLFTCKSLDATLDFYQALGFEVTYQQDSPYLYAAVQRSKIGIHFAKGAGGASCLIHVPHIAPYHAAFADGLRAKYGAIPTAGTPRITRLQPAQTRFQVFDPSGNVLLFINQDEPDIDYEALGELGRSPLIEALDNVMFLRDTYADDTSAAKFLDKKLKQHASAAPLDRARALAVRAELAVAMNDTETARAVRVEQTQIILSEEEYRRYADELGAADRLERWITQK